MILKDAEYYERRNLDWFDLIRQCVRENREPPKRDDWNRVYDAAAESLESNK